MTLNACRHEHGAAPAAADQLQPRCTADGSFTLWSERFGECFHSGSGAHAEAIGKFIAPAQLERFPAGSRLRVLEVCVGLGYNTAALVEAAAQRRLRLDWTGLELDPRPLALALADPGFRALWQTSSLRALEQLHTEGSWCSGDGRSGGAWRLGDARHQIAAVLEGWHGRCDLVLHDAFSPGRCPELWTAEFLTGLARLLKPSGRLLTYCAAAAVRQALQEAGLELASIASPTGHASSRQWCHGTVASPTTLERLSESHAVVRPLSAMERDHLLTRAAEPYRDPTGQASAAVIRAERAERQRRHCGESTSAWRRRWGLDRLPVVRAGEPEGSA